MKFLLCLFLSLPSLALADAPRIKNQAPSLKPPAVLEAKKEVGALCAKNALLAIYTAERAYYAENNTYSGRKEDIGYEPEKPPCTSWETRIQVMKEGHTFIAEAKHPSGERWTIDDKKELVQTSAGAK